MVLSILEEVKSMVRNLTQLVAPNSIYTPTLFPWPLPAVTWTHLQQMEAYLVHEENFATLVRQWIIDNFATITNTYSYVRNCWYYNLFSPQTSYGSTKISYY